MPDKEIDRPPVRETAPSADQLRRSTLAQPFNAEEMDGPDDLVLDEAAVTRAKPKVAWPQSDADAPDFAHLQPEGRETAVGDKEFELGAEELDLLIKANSFDPLGHDDRIVFALRGAQIVGRDTAEAVDQSRSGKQDPIIAASTA